jgi:hypothetical protein
MCLEGVVDPFAHLIYRKLACNRTDVYKTSLVLALKDMGRGGAVFYSLGERRHLSLSSWVLFKTLLQLGLFVSQTVVEVFLSFDQFIYRIEMFELPLQFLIDVGTLFGLFDRVWSDVDHLSRRGVDLLLPNVLLLAIAAGLRVKVVGGHLRIITDLINSLNRLN